MNNDHILHALDITAKLMELHDENPFKARAYANAAFRLKKLRYDFSGKTAADIAAIDGIGKGVVARIGELMTSGTTAELSDLVNRTPDGIIDMLAVKGLGPKKVRQLWQELQIENMGELLYACEENRLITLRGFGEKTQGQVRAAIEFRMNNGSRQLYARVEPAAAALLDAIRKAAPDSPAAWTGQMARRCEIVDRLELILTSPVTIDLTSIESQVPVPVVYHYCTIAEFEMRLVETSSTETHLKQSGFESVGNKEFGSSSEVYAALGMQDVAPELREGLGEVELAREKRLPVLIEDADLRGILHNHTTYSDGMHSLREMAEFCKGHGYSYLGICDHSRTAVYAGGLPIEKLFEQQREIDALNKEFSGFQILKGIESDILSDGSLDYPDDVLKTLDFVVASVHSNLKMPEVKATARLLKAIENPYTSILGHPSGRLLLAREGYPLNYKKIIDACAANGVVIELNANPNRLDIDWRWIPYCLEKGVMISINPDAHQREGLLDMRYGVNVARKGRLEKSACLNAMELADLLHWFRKKSGA
jgi:DNA polymerase (family 10)